MRKQFKLICRTCRIQTPEQMENQMNRRLFPRICIGHIALFLTGVALVLIELFG
ncbi:hypothetical protein AB1K83_17580 [Sporosarcina sp. 179-K 3D1 HS]|uniref:hypothetical protein n=1 Tax=Sporosarcina sp. 179-K 3D1 HS TaxID=3232169 RepID=UPI0039A39588